MNQRHYSWFALAAVPLIGGMFVFRAASVTGREPAEPREAQRSEPVVGRPQSPDKRRQPVSIRAAVRKPVALSVPASPEASRPASATDPVTVNAEPPAGLPATATGLSLGLRARAKAVQASLERLQARQEAKGLGLSSSVKSDWLLMEELLDRADRLAEQGKTEAASQPLRMAERQIEKLEEFLGR